MQPFLIQPDRRVRGSLLRTIGLACFCSFILYLTIAHIGGPSGTQRWYEGTATTSPQLNGAWNGGNTNPSSPSRPSPWQTLENPYASMDFAALDRNYTRTMVVARIAKEETSWIERELSDIMEPNAPLNTVIYVADDQTAPLHPPANKGHEAMVYLSYIIDSYDTLPDIAIFLHSNSTAYHNNDLLSSSASAMVRRLNSEKVLREGYVNLRCHWEPGCPNWIHPNPIRIDSNKEEEPAIGKAFAELFPNEPLPTVLSQPCCAQFAVAKRTILRHPKERYQTMRNWILTTPLDDTLSGRVFEYLWQYIFTSSPIHCPNMHVCYCDAYSICFESEDSYRAYINIHEVLGMYQDEKQKLLRRLAAGETVGEASLEWLTNMARDLEGELQARKEVAEEMGRNRTAKYSILKTAWLDLLEHPPGHLAEKYGHWGTDSAITP